MSATGPTADSKCTNRDFIRHAVGLLSQQIWCWGCDILRPEGNWLLEIGFDRIEPPPEREGDSSVYVLNFQKRCVVLRGFGVFYGDIERGGVFLHRYKFRPRYTTRPDFEHPPWSATDLPNLKSPNKSQQAVCHSLTSDLIKWIHSYEVDIQERLGIEHRRSTLLSWDNGNRDVTPAEEMVSAWKELINEVANKTNLS